MFLMMLFYFDPAHSQQVINELYFTADLTNIYGTGPGFFDPTEDVMDLMGLDWVGATVLADESERRFEEDPFNPGFFNATMVIQGQLGDSTKWKCKAEPEDHFFNWGWEISPDYWYVIQEDGHIAEITLKPNIFPVQPAIEKAVTVLFQVDMTNAKNFYSQDYIDPEEVEWVGLKGQNSVLGNWAGIWMPEDTASNPKTLHVLRDHGQAGDKVAGDFIFSAYVEFPAGNEGGPGLYKYGAYYEGALEENGGQNPLDNEMHGTDHWININPGGTTEVLNQFGVIEGFKSHVHASQARPVSIHMAQNYPNPFNPVTTIDYRLSTDGTVDLSVYNLQGQKVATLVNQYQQSGSHSAQFDATSLSSGVYVVQFKAGEIVSRKKMILTR